MNFSSYEPTCNLGAPSCGTDANIFAIAIYSPDAGHLAHLIKHANLIKSGDVMKMAELG